MKKVIIISLFVLGLIIPNIDVKAVDVSNEEELRAAIESGTNDIYVEENIDITKPIVINHDVDIESWGKFLYMKSDNTLITVNGGNVIINVHIVAGWDGTYNENGSRRESTVKGVGNGLVINGGNVLDTWSIYAGNIGVEVNGGTLIQNDSYIESRKYRN